MGSKLRRGLLESVWSVQVWGRFLKPRKPHQFTCVNLGQLVGVHLHPEWHLGTMWWVREQT